MASLCKKVRRLVSTRGMKRTKRMFFFILPILTLYFCWRHKLTAAQRSCWDEVCLDCPHFEINFDSVLEINRWTRQFQSHRRNEGYFFGLITMRVGRWRKPLNQQNKTPTLPPEKKTSDTPTRQPPPWHLLRSKFEKISCFSGCFCQQKEKG